MSAAIEEQRAATDDFAVSARETSVAVSDVAERMIGITDMVERSRVIAQEVSAIAAQMRATSHSLCREIPDIVRKAVKADLREYPRYDVNLTARLERNGVVADVAVRDVSEGGARIVSADNLKVGDQVELIFPGMKAIVGAIVRSGGDNLGICFTPSRLRPEELRDLVTAVDRAA